MKMTPEIREAIAKDVIHKGMTLQQLAEKYSVTTRTIQRNRETYRHTWTRTGQRLLTQYIQQQHEEMTHHIDILRKHADGIDDILRGIKCVYVNAQEIQKAIENWEKFLPTENSGISLPNKKSSY